MSKSASQVGIDLLLQRAGEKAKPFAGFDRGARQDDAVDLLIQQRRDGHSHGEVGLARAGGTDAKDHVVLLDGFEIAALIGAFRLNGAASKRTLAAGFGQAAQGGVRIAYNHAQHAAQVAVHELVAGAAQVLVVGEQLFGASHVAGRAFQFNVARAQIDIDVQAVFEHVEIFIARAEQGLDVGSEINTFFHSGC